VAGIISDQILSNARLLSDAAIAGLPSVNAWARACFVLNQDLLYSMSSRGNLNGLDYMILLAWVVQKFASFDGTWVLHYWDLHPPNVMLDERYDVVG
jgi:hypothetical protein